MASCVVEKEKGKKKVIQTVSNYTHQEDHEINELLIVLVFGEKNIFQKNHDEFRDEVKRMNSFKKISKLMEETQGIKVTGTNFLIYSYSCIHI